MDKPVCGGDRGGYLLIRLVNFQFKLKIKPYVISRHMCLLLYFAKEFKAIIKKDIIKKQQVQ